GGSFNIQPASGSTISFSVASGSTNIKFLGGDLTTTAIANTQIDSGVTVTSDSNVTIKANGSTFTNNQTLTSSKATGATISIQSTGALTIAGTGTISATGTTSGTNLISLSTTGNNQLLFTGSQTYNAVTAGTAGSV